MKKGLLVSIIGLMFVTILAGCGEPKVNDGPPKKVIGTYLEGFRDKQPEKIYNSVSFEAYQELRFPGKLENMFKAQDAQVGKITGWSFTGKPYLDELNNQALIQTVVKTTKQTFTFQFDLRRIGDRWYVYGIDQNGGSGGGKKDPKYNMGNFK